MYVDPTKAIEQSNPIAAGNLPRFGVGRIDMDFRTMVACSAMRQIHVLRIEKVRRLCRDQSQWAIGLAGGRVVQWYIGWQWIMAMGGKRRRIELTFAARCGESAFGARAPVRRQIQCGPAVAGQ